MGVLGMRRNICCIGFVATCMDAGIRAVEANNWDLFLHNARYQKDKEMAKQKKMDAHQVLQTQVDWATKFQEAAAIKVEGKTPVDITETFFPESTSDGLKVKLHTDGSIIFLFKKPEEGVALQGEILQGEVKEMYNADIKGTRSIWFTPKTKENVLKVGRPDNVSESSDESLVSFEYGFTPQEIDGFAGTTLVKRQGVERVGEIEEKIIYKIPCPLLNPEDTTTRITEEGCKAWIAGLKGQQQVLSEGHAMQVQYLDEFYGIEYPLGTCRVIEGSFLCIQTDLDGSWLIICKRGGGYMDGWRQDDLKALWTRPFIGRTEIVTTPVSGHVDVDILSGTQVKEECEDNSSWLKIGFKCWQLSRVELVDGELKQRVRAVLQMWCNPGHVSSA